MAIVAKELTPPEYWRWEFAEKFGWTLDYIDALSIGDFQEYIQVMDGKSKGYEELRRRMPPKRKR